MLTMLHENILLAFFSLNGITFHSYKPDLVIIVVFFTSSRAIGIWQKPNYKSSTKNHWERPN